MENYRSGDIDMVSYKVEISTSSACVAELGRNNRDRRHQNVNVQAEGFFQKTNMFEIG